MERATRPLVVAIVAATLLVIVVGVDASMNRTFTLEANEPGGEPVTVLRSTTDRSYAEHPEPSLADTIEVNRTDEVTFELTVDNGYPWSFEEPYAVRANGALLASGTLTADGSSEASTTFTVTASELIQAQPQTQVPRTIGTNIELTVGSSTFFGWLDIQEVQR